MPESKPKHTPGPWNYSWRTDGIEIWAPDSGQHVATLEHYSKARGVEHVCRREDAALIARAPDLLAENERLRSEVQRREDANRELVNQLDRSESEKQSQAYHHGIRIEALESELAELREDYQSAETERDHFYEEAKRLRAELNELKAELNPADGVKDWELECEVVSLRAENERLRRELETANQLVADRTNESIKLRLELAELRQAVEAVSHSGLLLCPHLQSRSHGRQGQPCGECIQCTLRTALARTQEVK
jgi:chromosome segregation ATPase